MENQHRKKLCVSLSAHVEKPLNSKKVNKSFVHEPKQRVVRVFRVFSDSYMHNKHSMSISRIHILVVYFWIWIYYIRTFLWRLLVVSMHLLCIVISFLALWFSCQCSLVHFKNGLEFLTRGQPRCSSLWWDFCYIVGFRIDFFFHSPAVFFSSPHV